jgi:hypothetical protein
VSMKVQLFPAVRGHIADSVRAGQAARRASSPWLCLSPGSADGPVSLSGKSMVGPFWPTHGPQDPSEGEAFPAGLDLVADSPSLLPPGSAVVIGASLSVRTCHHRTRRVVGPRRCRGTGGIVGLPGVPRDTGWVLEVAGGERTIMALSATEKQDKHDRATLAAARAARRAGQGEVGGPDLERGHQGMAAI